MYGNSDGNEIYENHKTLLITTQTRIPDSSTTKHSSASLLPPAHLLSQLRHQIDSSISPRILSPDQNQTTFLISDVPSPVNGLAQSFTTKTPSLFGHMLSPPGTPPFSPHSLLSAFIADICLPVSEQRPRSPDPQSGRVALDMLSSAAPEGWDPVVAMLVASSLEPQVGLLLTTADVVSLKMLAAVTRESRKVLAFMMTEKREDIDLFVWWDVALSNAIMRNSGD